MSQLHDKKVALMNEKAHLLWLESGQSGQDVFSEMNKRRLLQIERDLADVEQKIADEYRRR